MLKNLLEPLERKTELTSKITINSPTTQTRIFSYISHSLPWQISCLHQFHLSIFRMKSAKHLMKHIRHKRRPLWKGHNSQMMVFRRKSLQLLTAI